MTIIRWKAGPLFGRLGWSAAEFLVWGGYSPETGPACLPFEDYIDDVIHYEAS
jgi:hypothetical protein